MSSKTGDFVRAWKSPDKFPTGPSLWARLRLQFWKAEAAKSRALPTAFRPSRAGTTLIENHTMRLSDGPFQKNCSLMGLFDIKLSKDHLKEMLYLEPEHTHQYATYVACTCSSCSVSAYEWDYLGEILSMSRWALCASQLWIWSFAFRGCSVAEVQSRTEVRTWTFENRTEVQFKVQPLCQTEPEVQFRVQQDWGGSNRVRTDTGLTLPSLFFFCFLSKNFLLTSTHRMQ